MILLDTNIIIDLLSDRSDDEAAWSRRRYDAANGTHVLVCNHVVLAELAAGTARLDVLAGDLDRLHVDVVPLTIEAAFAGGQAFADYRRRGGARHTILADFLIGGHAVAIGASLMTRDRRLGSYFPDLTLITPETHP